MSDSPRIKGSALLGVLAWVGEHGGRESRQQMVAEISGPGAEVFAEPIRSTRWYPYKAYAALLMSLDRLLRSDSFTLQDVGRWTGKRDVGGILKIVSVFTSPAAVVARGFSVWGPSYWSRFCDAGAVSLAHHHHFGASIALDGFGGIAPEHCTLMEGWWEAMAESAGAHGVHVMQSYCVHRGDSHCMFEGTWR